ncbi:BnaC02g33850D [Brassica napus]|uniref:BnaC02g33850D protein n=2 Tax=Brassica napus TaxID=3708 RepID=A0A078HHM3_BRANA|nr:BnaC02g33850D [Brassica napus]
MPLLRIALQSPAGAARGQLIFKDLSRLKRFNSEEAIEYRLIIVRPLHIKDDAPLQDES